MICQWRTSRNLGLFIFTARTGGFIQKCFRIIIFFKLLGYRRENECRRAWTWKMDGIPCPHSSAALPFPGFELSVSKESSTRKKVSRLILIWLKCTSTDTQGTHCLAAPTACFQDPATWTGLHHRWLMCEGQTTLSPGVLSGGLPGGTGG